MAFNNLKIGDLVGIYKIIDTDASRTKDGHKQVHVQCTQCGLERYIRLQNLGAGICNHKRKVEPKCCKFCGDIIPYTEQTSIANYKRKVFCNSSCAAKFNNRRVHSEESKVKASKTLLLKHYSSDSELYEAIQLAKKEQKAKTRSIQNSSKYCAEGLVIGQDFVVCPYCNLRFSQIQTGHLKTHNKTFLDLYTDFGADYNTICSKTSGKKSSSSKEAQQRLLDNGVHKGWQSRKVISYAEKFWTTVLENNNIKFEREFLITSDLTHYFLDFKLERNGKVIDLEIDGKQHTYQDRIEHDAIRDAFLSEQGYIVYRIPWNEINTEAGKQKMQQKISDFLEFYSAL